MSKVVIFKDDVYMDYDNGVEYQIIRRHGAGFDMVENGVECWRCYEDVERLVKKEYGTTNFIVPEGPLHTAFRESGDFIECISSIREGLKLIAEYEIEDLHNGNFEIDYYDIVDDNHESLIY